MRRGAIFQLHPVELYLLLLLVADEGKSSEPPALLTKQIDGCRVEEAAEAEPALAMHALVHTHHAHPRPHYLHYGCPALPAHRLQLIRQLAPLRLHTPHTLRFGESPLLHRLNRLLLPLLRVLGRRIPIDSQGGMQVAETAAEGEEVVVGDTRLEQHQSVVVLD